MSTLLTQATLCLLETSCQATVLAAVVVLLGLLLRERLSARWRCALWLVVVVRLFLPVAPTSPVSLFNLLPLGLVSSDTTAAGAKAPEPDARGLAAVRLQAPLTEQPAWPSTPPIAEPSAAAEAQLDAPAHDAPWLLLASGWALGVLVLAARFVVQSVRLHKILRRCTAVENATVQQVFETTHRDVGLRRRVALLASPQGVGPAVTGMLRPKLIVSDTLLEQLSREEWRLVFLHELSHVRRRDLWVQPLWRLAQMLHWFNPAVWFSARRWQTDRELACDEAVLARLDRPQQVGYGRAMLRVLESLSSLHPMPGTLGVVTGRGFLTRRIAMIAHYRPLSRRWTFLAAGLLLLLALVGLTNAVGQPPKPASSPEATVQADAALNTAEREKTTTVTGVCVDEQGNPLEGATVMLFELRDDGKPTQKVASAQTDPQGAFQFAGVPTPEREAQQTGSWGYRALAKKAGRASAGVHLDPDPGKPYPLRLVMPPPATLSGHVTNQDGRPVAGAAVLYGFFAQLDEGIQAARTDEQGHFEITDMAAWGPEGSRTLLALVRHPDYAVGRILFRQVPATVEIALEPAAILQGRVLDRVTGKPAAGVPVSVQSTDNSAHDYWGHVLTDSEGNYRLSDVPSGTLNIWPTAKDRTAVAIDSLAVQAGQTLQAPDLTLIEGGFLEGRVLDAETGKAIDRGGLGRLLVGAQGPARPASGAAVQAIDVDANCRFRLRLPPGTYQPYLMGSTLKSSGWQPKGFETSSVELQEGQTRWIEFHILPPGDDTQPPGPGARPLRDYVLPPGSDPSPSTVRFLYRRQALPGPPLATPRGLPLPPPPADSSEAPAPENRKGTIVEGTITTPDGKPAAGATVGIHMYTMGIVRADFPRTKTDENGSYRFAVEDPNEYVVATVAEDYVPAWKRVSVGRDRQTLDLQLREGQPIRVRVVDQEEKSISGAHVGFIIKAEDLRRGNCELLLLDYERAPERWNKRTDAEGRWSLPWIPEDKIWLQVEKEGYLTANQAVTADDSEVTIRLEPGICISGRVVDRKTQAPIQNFRVVPGVTDSANRQVTWERSRPVTNENGEYRIYLNTLMDNRAVRIEADGYLPSTPQYFGKNERQPTYHFQLKKGDNFTGVIRSPEGNPLPAVEVVLCKPGLTCHVENGQVGHMNDPASRVRTDSEGRFSFSPQSDPYLLLAVHEQGVALVTDSAPRQNITLSPWSRIEGTVILNGKPAARQRICLDYSDFFTTQQPLLSPNLQPTLAVGRHFETVTDAQGHFVWERALPGQAEISRKLPRLEGSSYSSWTDAGSRMVELYPGRTLEVTFHDLAIPTIREREEASRAPAGQALLRPTEKPRKSSPGSIWHWMPAQWSP